MRTVALALATLLFLALSVLVDGWPAMKELWRAKDWQVARLDQPQGELDGLRLDIARQRAMIFPSSPDRALVYLRLGLQGEPQTIETFDLCDVGLTDAQGRLWRPLPPEFVSQVAQLMGDGRDDPGLCRTGSKPPDGGPAFSGHAFLVPVDVLDELRVQFSAANTRPRAISLPFRPALRPPPT